MTAFAVTVLVALGLALTYCVCVGARDMRKAKVAMDAILAEIDHDRRAAAERAEADRQIDQQIDELNMTLWAQHARREGWIPARPHDQ